MILVRLHIRLALVAYVEIRYLGNLVDAVGRKGGEKGRKKGGR